MPNLVPPVTTTEMAMTYRAEILELCPGDCNFEPLMTLYLTDHTSPADVRSVAESPYVHAFKLYPAGATTNSESGVTSLPDLMPTLEAMAEYGVPLLVHGEVTNPDVDIFDREAVFIDRVLSHVIDAVPGLKMVFEHVTTRDGVGFVMDAGDNVAATITAHHLLMNRNAMFNKGLRPHHYCLPVLKREEHRLALVAAAASGSKKFFLGTDSAPHDVKSKESACGCAGMYSAPVALSVYAQVFEENDALEQLEGFASLNGPAFYGMAPNEEEITLIKRDWKVPDFLPAGDESIVPLCAGEILRWQVR
jgi:dihydroorotase